MRTAIFMTLFALFLGCDDAESGPADTPPDTADAAFEPDLATPDAADPDAAVEDPDAAELDPDLGPEPDPDAALPPPDAAPAADASGSPSDAALVADAAPCIDGAANCPCADGDACDEGLFCAGGVCRVPNCDAGDEGCACFEDGTCRTGPDGNPMQCVDRACRVVGCPTGELGCGCGAFGACDAGLICQDARCVELGCDPGTLDCVCDEGACGGGAVCRADRCIDPGCAPGSERCVCSNGACGDGLACDAGICVDACPDGREGCACDAGTCEAGAACIDDICEAYQCVPGTPDCVCDADGACGGGTRCIAGRCQQPGCQQGNVGCECDGEACEAGTQCSALDICRGCPLGAAGCACDEGLCDDGLDCDGTDTCVLPGCEAGTEGCGCIGGERCGINTRGEAMACEDGRCVAPSCTPGAAGCPCLDGVACLAPGDACSDGFCQAAGCAPGTLDCRCNQGHCEGELTCRDSAVCVLGEGFVDGPCLVDGSCLEGGICTNGRCESCNLGTEGCGCRQGACFGGGLCLDAVCVDGAGVELPPENPVCYRSCNRSYEDENGIWRRCDDEGLMEGCGDGRDCVLGNCLAEGQERRVCAADYDCPDYQACIAGNCYSNCAADRDCSGAQECYRKVCRTPCRTDGDEVCGADEYCQSNDGALGFCMPLVPPTPPDGPDTPPGAIRTDVDTLSFNPATLEARLVVTNEAAARATIRVRKLSHEILTANGERQTLSDPDDGADCDPAQGCPLFWLELSEPAGDGARVQTYELDLAAGESKTVVIGGAGGVQAARWQGVLEVIHPTLNTVRVVLDYAETPTGTWNGNVYYFASFGTASLDDWASLGNPAAGSPPAQWAGTKDDARAQEEVGNAFIQRWGAFRRGRIDWEEFQAVLTATQAESWRWTRVQEDCPVDACYLYDSNRLGLREYSSDLDSVPVPTGVVELPIGVSIHQPNANQPGRMTGKIDSVTSLQYAGNPAIELTFDGDPSSCTRQVGGACMVYLNDLSAEVVVGGRYETDQADSNCAEYPGGTFAQVATPWLLTDFARNTAIDPTNGRRYRYDCRDQTLPFQAGINPAAEGIANLALVGANPVPDGRPRRRHIELVDGAMINQSLLFVIFKERFESFLDPVGDTDGFEAYGYMLLTRADAAPEEVDEDGDGTADVYQGSTPEDDRDPPLGLLDVSCDDAVVSEVLQRQASLAAGNVGSVVTGIIEGTTAPAQASFLEDGDDEFPHYLCMDEGTFDFTCPAESRVIYFTADRGELGVGEIVTHECNDDGTCLETLLNWRDRGRLAQYDVPWRCADPNAAFCSDDRLDLREGKLFYAQGDDAVVGLPLRAQIDEAFRYKTRFRTRQGRNLGFAPSECLPDSNEIPYCYDPAAIEAIREKVDCLVHIQDAWYGRLSVSQRATLDTYLRENFSYTVQNNALGEPVIYDGFERLYSELLVMMGDEAITRSFASRFDLAGANVAAFEGSLFEEGGIDLSGQAGFELYKLYQSLQYYAEALDRFYALSPQFWRASQAGEASTNFITPETVTHYMERLIRASTQKTKAWSEVAERYQGFNRPDLSRRVMERAYTGAYLESVVFSRMMQSIVDNVAPEDRAQIEDILFNAQIRYRIALNDMREAYGDITDDRAFFGVAPDYIPIPAMDTADYRQSNAFEVLSRRLQDKVAFAADREERAIESNRSFDSDTAQFQAELVRIRNTYEDQLASICGTFPGDDGVIYPATTRYADRSDYTAVLGSPCGLVGNGELTEQYGQVESLKTDVKRAAVALDNTLASIEIERQRASDQCEVIFDIADYVFEQDGVIQTLETVNATARFAINRADRTLGALSTFSQLAACSPITGTCATAAGAAGALAAAQIAVEATVGVLEAGIIVSENRISQIRRETAKWQTEQQCNQLLIDSNARMADMTLRIAEQELELLRAEQQVRLAISGIHKLRQRATRLEQQQAEAQQLQINSEAARNDPNIRIYRNDAIINADFAYEDAMREAYRLTKVFEYYTSMSYADRNRLYFIRLVRRSEDNLENYLAEIRNAFFEFEEQYGLPDTRVLQVSLMNDILAIPRADAAGEELSDSQRAGQLRAALRDPANLDENGYLALPFSTDVASLSPLTRNHKVLYIEAEIIASDFGADHLARLYLRQDGTGVLRGFDNRNDYYRLPRRYAVINPFFSGVRFFNPETYKNYRLRDRPLVNTSWTLVINQRDEVVNQDIDLQSVSDIRLFIYYSDFTADF